MSENATGIFREGTGKKARNAPGREHVPKGVRRVVRDVDLVQKGSGHGDVGGKGGGGKGAREGTMTRKIVQHNVTQRHRQTRRLVTKIRQPITDRFSDKCLSLRYTPASG